MGRRKRKVVRITRRQLPEFFLCPRCGKNMVKANINRKQERVVVFCGNCGLNSAFKASSQMVAVDAYCRFVDLYYGVGSEEATAVG